MKVIFMCGTGSNHRALANRMSEMAMLSHIAVVEAPPPKRHPNIGSRIAFQTIGRPLRNAWRSMMAHYDELYPSFPDVPQSRHVGANAESMLELIRGERPELVLVSGTDLLRKRLIDAAHANGRIMNLHTGLSPYLKGGPNCTNWALALAEFDLIGSSVMWLDAGIDSGNLIATERTPLTGRESLTELHTAVMDHAHSLYQRCYGRALKGLALPSVAQSEIDEGRLFLTRHWTAGQIGRAVINFKTHYSSATVCDRRKLRLVSIEEA